MPSLPEDQPLLPAPVTSQTPTLSAASRSKLQARRYLPTPSSSSSSSTSTPPPQPPLSGQSEKAKGKQRALDIVTDTQKDGEDDDDELPITTAMRRKSSLGKRGISKDGIVGKNKSMGRNVTIIFTNEAEAGGGGNLDIWVEDGETVGVVKERIRHLRPQLESLTLRLIHSGRLLTDGILLLPWLRSLEERVRRQAAGMGGDVESVLKDVGLGEEDEEDGDEGIEHVRDLKKGSSGSGETRKEEQKVWLHCNVGGKIESRDTADDETDEPAALPSRRRGFDALLDAGLSPAEVAQMRRQFYESRGEEVPEGLDLGDVNDEHARALEEQWIEGDLTAETATTSTEGLYTSILQGLLTGFLYPLSPLFFIRELPLPNFFDADAEANGTDVGGVSGNVASGLGAGDGVTSVVFGKRMQMGILLGTFINLAFGALRFLN